MKLKIWVQIRKTDLQCHFKSGRGEGDWEGGSQCPPYSAKSWIRPCKIRYTVRYLKCLPEISDFYRWQFRHWSQWWEWWWQPPRPAVCTGWSSCLLRQNKTIQHPNAGPIVNYLSPWKKKVQGKMNEDARAQNDDNGIVIMYRYCTLAAWHMYRYIYFSRGGKIWFPEKWGRAWNTGNIVLISGLSSRIQEGKFFLKS